MCSVCFEIFMCGPPYRRFRFSYKKWFKKLKEKKSKNEGSWIFYYLSQFSTNIIHHVPSRRPLWNNDRRIQTIHAVIQRIDSIKIIGSIRKINNPTKIGVKYFLKASTSLLCVPLICSEIHKVESDVTPGVSAIIFLLFTYCYTFITSVSVFLLFIKGLTPIAGMIKEK